MFEYHVVKNKSSRIPTPKRICSKCTFWAETAAPEAFFGPWCKHKGPGFGTHCYMQQSRLKADDAKQGHSTSVTSIPESLGMMLTSTARGLIHVSYVGDKPPTPGPPPALSQAVSRQLAGERSGWDSNQHSQGAPRRNKCYNAGAGIIASNKHFSMMYSFIFPVKSYFKSLLNHFWEVWSICSAFWGICAHGCPSLLSDARCSSHQCWLETCAERTRV